MAKIYRFTALTGSDETCLDNLDGAVLNNGDIAIVTVSGVIYFYVLEHDNSSAESSPGIIQPNRNYGTKRWVLQSTYWSIVSTVDPLLRMYRGDMGSDLKNQFLVIDSSGKWQWATLTDAGAYLALQMTLDRSGNLYVTGNCSAQSFTDRTKYPESVQQAYDALASMTGKDGKVDHGKLHPFIQGSPDVDKEGNETPTRDLGAVVSCQAAVIQDLIARLEKLEKK